MTDDPARELRRRLIRVLLIGGLICGGAIALLGPKPMVLAPIIGGAAFGLFVSYRAVRRADHPGADGAGDSHG